MSFRLRHPILVGLGCCVLLGVGLLAALPGQVSFGQGPETPDTPGWQTYPDTDPALVYSNGTWQTFAVTEALGGSLTGTADPGATLTAHFEGTAIQIVYSLGPEGQTFSGQVDNASVVTVFSYGDQYSYGSVLAFPDLAPGQHVLTVANGDGALWIEAVQVKGTLLDLSTPSPTPTPAPLFPSELLAAPDSSQPIDALDALPANVPYEIVSDSAGFIAALNRANAEGPLAIYLQPGTYVLQDTHTVRRNTYVYGRGHAETIITGPAGKLYFSVMGGITLEISHATITGASTTGYGGAVSNYGQLVIADAVLMNNRAGSGGGGIFNAGRLEIARTTFSGNRAGGGGAIQNDLGGQLEATCTRFEQNVSGYATVLQGQVSNSAGTITIHSSSFANNTLQYPGDVVKLDPSGTVDISGNWWGGGNPVTGNSAIIWQPVAGTDPLLSEECQTQPPPDPLSLPPLPQARCREPDFDIELELQQLPTLEYDPLEYWKQYYESLETTPTLAVLAEDFDGEGNLWCVKYPICEDKCLRRFGQHKWLVTS